MNWIAGGAEDARLIDRLNTQPWQDKIGTGNEATSPRRNRLRATVQALSTPTFYEDPLAGRYGPSSDFAWALEGCYFTFNKQSLREI